MIKLERISDHPILEPVKGSSWEGAAVFNCAAIFDNGLVHMIYRASDIAPNGKSGPFVSRLGYAVSKDGLKFNRLREPVITNNVPQEARGSEDPRIVKIDDTFYIMYTGYTGDDYRICMASSKNLIDWHRHGIVLDEKNKDASLFPEKLNGKYVMFHRRDPDIWIAYSDDLIKWTDHRKIMSPVSSSRWESKKIGIAGPPVKTDKGWFLIYHGVSEDDNSYSLGAALLDLKDPSRVVERQSEPVLESVLDWEKEGAVPNVVFSCGQVEIGNELIVYYCGADTVIGAAKLKKSDIIF